MWRCVGSLILFLLFVPGALAATRKNVLILHEGSRLLPYQFEVSSEIQRDLSSTRFDIQVFEEYLDSWRLSQNPWSAVSALEAKYVGLKFDVVVVDGNAPFQAMLNRPPAFLRGTPVVFVSLPDYDLPSRLPANITGITAHKEYRANVGLAMRLQPGLQHIFFVQSGLAPNALRDEAVRNELASFRNQLDIVNLENLAIDDLLKRVASLPPHSAIVFDTYFKDPSGKPYIPADVSDLIAKRANAPLYAIYQTTMANGALGGVVIGSESVGKQATEIVLGLLGGAPVSRYPVEHSQNKIMIDWRSFQRFGLSESHLPSSVVVLNRPPSLWERYRGYLIAAGVVMLLQTILIIELGLAGKRWKRSERSARELARRLINAQEEERRRLALELHDDVSQRLALVAIQLDILRKSPPASRNDLIGELSVLFDETDLISSDIHQFSHELHPAILERLGLASALRRYCAEFSVHRKIAVHMSTTGEEPRLNDETALAFFRIGQECLTNAAKHSGTFGCKVSLTYAHDRITLVAEDNGSGFDPKSAQAQTGLGLQSMRERLRSIGGTLRIRSSVLGGTTIFAEAPLGPPATTQAPEIMPEETSVTESETSTV
jgi:signal transduction histidine kinase